MAKKQISEQAIVQAAAKLVAERGIEALNVRSVAAYCGCSTQPIYSCFNSMLGLKKAVLQQILQAYDRCIEQEIASGAYPDYKASGMGYIRFAKEQPNFFKFMFMRDRSGEEDAGDPYFFHREAMRATAYGVSEDEAERMHTHMWIYVHGIAVMFVTGYLNWDWQTVSDLLTEEFMAMKAKLFGGNNGN